MTAMRSTFVAICVLSLLVMAGLVMAGLAILRPFGDACAMHAERPFDAAEWARFELDDHGHSSRLPMARALVDEGALEGRTRAEVEALLGPPAYERWSQLFPHPGWKVGGHPYSSDDTGLIVRFDDSGRAVEAMAPGY